MIAVPLPVMDDPFSKEEIDLALKERHLIMPQALMVLMVIFSRNADT
jgi:hypothetical protein